MRLERNQINRGKYCLLKISESNFEKFKHRLNSDITFEEEIAKLELSNKRDKKIDGIIDDIN